MRVKVLNRTESVTDKSKVVSVGITISDKDGRFSNYATHFVGEQPNLVFEVGAIYEVIFTKVKG